MDTLTIILWAAALSFAVGWFYRAHLDKAAVQAAVSAANAKAEADIRAWRAAADQASQAYQDQKALTDAQAQQLQDALDKLAGGSAPLDPYLAHAAALLWPAPGQGGGGSAAR